MIRFENPFFLAFLLIIPLMMFYQWKGLGRSRLKFSSLDNLKCLKKPSSIFLRHILLLLRCLAIALLVMALARPQTGTKTKEVLSEGIDIILCLDTSGSMQTADFIYWDELNSKNERHTRLQVVKKVVSHFIKKRQYDRIGMVVFGNEAFTQCPLTLDHGVLLSFLDQLEIGMVGHSTAIGSALGTCVKRLKGLKSKAKIVILLTDGRNNAGSVSPETAAEVARMFAVKTYTIGVGEKERPPPLKDMRFGKSYIDQWGELDEDILKGIAKTTGGTYFKATTTKALENIYRQINALEKTKVKVKEYMEYEELFRWFLIPGLACILLEIILANTRFKKIP
jgi:Ca-activated chloride channel family protein